MKSILILLTTILLLGCSSSENEGNENSPGEEKLLRYVKSNADWLTYKIFNTYHYENEKLVKMYNSSQQSRFQFEYSNGKIHRIAGENYDWSQENINDLREDFTFNVTYPGSKNQGEIIYSGQNISRTFYSGETISLSQGKIQQLQTHREFMTNWVQAVWDYQYDTAGNFIKKTHTYSSSQHEYRYEFDNKVNPYYILYQKFGFFEYAYSITPEVSRMDEFTFPHNITKIYKDDVLVFSAIYHYDGDGYPISKTTVDYTHLNPDYTNNSYEYKYFE